MKWKASKFLAGEMRPRDGVLLGRAILAVFLLAGAVSLLAHRHVPIERNSLVYANIVYHLIDHGRDFNVKQDAYNKPLGFAYLSYCFVKRWGANTGLKMTSFLVAVLWALSLLIFYRRFAARFGVGEGDLWLLLLVTFLNPLVLYQFISAYPDLLYALTFLWAFFFLDRYLSPEVRWFDGLLFGAFAWFGVFVKHNGFIILPVLGIFLCCRWATVAGLLRDRKLEMAIGALAVAAAGISIALAMQGHDFKLFNFSHNAKNYLSGGQRLKYLTLNSVFFCLYLVICFNVLLRFLFPLPGPRRQKELYLSLGACLFSLLFYKGTRFNIRYYLTLTPFLCLILAANIARRREAAKKVLIIFTAIGLYLSCYYNSIAFHDLMARFIPLPPQDNLRLVREQLEGRDSIRRINDLHSREGFDTLVFISKYYGDGAWRAWERSGLFEPGLRIFYTATWNKSFLAERGIRRIMIYEFYEPTKTLLADRNIKPFLLRRSPKVYTLDLDKPVAEAPNVR